MDEQLIQRSRYVLHARAKRVKTCPEYLFPSASLHWLTWLNSHPILKYNLEYLNNLSFETKDKFLASKQAMLDGKEIDRGFVYLAKNNDEHAAICLFIVSEIAQFTGEMNQDKIWSSLANYATLLNNSWVHKVEDVIELLRDVAIDGLFEYLDEQLDSRNILYGLLLKYKQRSEWFYRERLRSYADIGLEGYSGERALAVDLQEYIFNQGVEFSVEPKSKVGRPDLILVAPEGKKVVVETKYIRKDSSRASVVNLLKSAFHQVFVYCQMYNEPDGFLVIFMNDNKRISMDLEQIDGLGYFKIGGKIIYPILITITDEDWASKLGEATELNISKDELKTEIKSEEV
ncbi:MAG: McrC family protein [Ignavibacteriales bacterium]|jgi:hypothetical protein|nr:McrC family protein [Ignavibacteriales bacterium]MDX9712478.1 hypothetical protein [Ignavibacteriaceae bacterium]